MFELGTGTTDAPADLIKDSSEATFMQDVIEVSDTVPVIVDFWAPWCGPCKTLGPMLEDAVKAAKGAVKMVKVNVDEAQMLAGQLRIQSIPTIYAFFQGQPVGGFSGAKSKSEVQSLIRQLVQMADQHNGQDNGDIEQYLNQAVAAFANKDFDQAGHIYQAILRHDPQNTDAFCGLVRTFITLGHIDQAQNVMEQACDQIQDSPAYNEVKTALDLALELAGQMDKGDVAELLKSLEQDPKNHETRFDLANLYYQNGDYEQAIDALLAIIQASRDWNDGKAREQLLKFFEALGTQNPLTMSGRRTLSTILFS